MFSHTLTHSAHINSCNVWTSNKCIAWKSNQYENSLSSVSDLIVFQIYAPVVLCHITSNCLKVSAEVGGFFVLFYFYCLASNAFVLLFIHVFEQYVIQLNVTSDWVVCQTFLNVSAMDKILERLGLPKGLADLLIF